MKSEKENQEEVLFTTDDGEDVTFSDLLKTAKNKQEIIITFLALLELIKQRIFSAEQEALFADVVIKKTEIHGIENGLTRTETTAVGI
jgi:segregation and condensation protein A